MARKRMHSARIGSARAHDGRAASWRPTLLFAALSVTIMLGCGPLTPGDSSAAIGNGKGEGTLACAATFFCSSAGAGALVDLAAGKSKLGAFNAKLQGRCADGALLDARAVGGDVSDRLEATLTADGEPLGRLYASIVQGKRLGRLFFLSNADVETYQQLTSDEVKQTLLIQHQLCLATAPKTYPVDIEEDSH